MYMMEMDEQASLTGEPHIEGLRNLSRCMKVSLQSELEKEKYKLRQEIQFGSRQINHMDMIIRGQAATS